MSKKRTITTPQPRCGAGTKQGCNHPASFHGGGKTRCRALGCSCSRWHKPVPAKLKKAG